MGELLIGLQQFLIAGWFFVTYKPLVEAAVEEELTVVQRLKRRWKQSKDQAERQRQKAAQA
jgi:hypothetical protein